MAKDLRGQRSDARHQVSINALRGHQQCILGAVLLNEDVGGVVEVEIGDRHFGFQSRASFCASAICAGAIRSSSVSRFSTAVLVSGRKYGELDAARSNHLG